MPNTAEHDTAQAAEMKKIEALAEQEARAQGIPIGDAPEKAYEEPVAEKPTPEAPESPEGVSPPEAPASKDVPTERMIPESVFQKRMDEMTAERYALKREMEEMKATLTTPSTKEKTYTDEELRYIAQKYATDPEHPEYAVQAQEQLLDRKVERKLAEREQRDHATAQQRALLQAHDSVWQSLVKDHADLSNTSSDLWKAANDEYQKVPLRKRQEWPEEMAQAVERAQAKLAAQKNGKASTEAARAAAAAKKGVIPLGGTARATTSPSANANLEKLHQKASETNEEADWLAYMRASQGFRKPKKEE